MADTTSGHRRIVVIGAARSGTKILRDSLAAATGAGVVPYDVGYVWRYGNLATPDDVLDPSSVTDRVRRFITTFVDGYASSGAVVEKTVGNTLRVPFVSAVLPDSRYVHLIRDGVDVTESTCRQWTTPADTRYLVEKVRHFPVRLVPTYGRRYAASLLRRRVHQDGRVASWGPRYPGIDEDLRTEELITVCARQWRESVSRAQQDLARLGLPVLEIRYEDLVARPEEQLARAAEFCELDVAPVALQGAARGITPGRAGTGGRSLDPASLRLVDDEIGPLLTQLGYPRPPREETTE